MPTGGWRVADEVVRLDLFSDPGWHLVEKPLACRISFERGAHFDDVEIDRSGRDRLLQTRIVVRLGEIDPVDGGARVGLPRLEESAKQEVVEILVVQPHKGQFNTGELPFVHPFLRGPEAHLADLLPVGIGR